MKKAKLTLKEKRKRINKCAEDMQLKNHLY